MEEQPKHLQYGGLIALAISDMLNNEDSEFHISHDELQEGSNLTHFIHALANLAPTLIYNEITGSQEDNLGFNHIANRLCCQYNNNK